MSSKEEKDVLDFLDSLPDTQNGSKSDKEILDFLDELDAPQRSTQKEEHKEESTSNPTQTPAAKETPPSNDPTPPTQEETKNDPLKSISSWWSTATNTATSTLWDTAQSLSNQADQAINTLKSAPLEDNIRNAFKELGITGINDYELTDEQRERILNINLDEAKKAIDLGFTKGIDLVNNVIETINSRDEILEIVFVHDMNVEIAKSFKNLIKNTFEEVMSDQVDGRIDVKILETSPSNQLTNQESNWNLFLGKSNDAEKLSKANIEAEIKSRKDDSPVIIGEQKVAKSQIFISLLGWTIAKDIKKGSINDLNETISSHSSNSFSFLCTLEDTTHNIHLSAHSQPLPIKWAQWSQNDYNEDEFNDLDQIDPNDWVSKWILGAVVGVIGTVAQSYIIRRMGY